MTEDSPKVTIELADVFDDIDDTLIEKEVVSSNPEVVVSNITGETLSLEFPQNASGSSLITILASSNGKVVSDSLNVTVLAVDDPPSVSTPISDLAANEDDPDRPIDLSNVFDDPDGDPDHKDGLHPETNPSSPWAPKATSSP